MRPVTCVAVLAAVVSVGPQAHADKADVARIVAPPATVVAIMDKTRQALLWDSNQGEYVVVRAGDRFHQFRVTSIEPDRVILSHKASRQHFILPRTSDGLDRTIRGGERSQADPSGGPHATSTSSLDRRGASRANAIPAEPGAAAPARHTGARKPDPGSEPVLDPYASPRRPPRNNPDVVEPYARPAAPTKAAVIDPYADAPRGAPLLDPYASSEPATPSDARGARAPRHHAGRTARTSRRNRVSSSRISTVPQTGEMRVERRRISRRRFNAAMSDFGAIASEAQFELVPDGVRVDRLEATSFFHGMGVRAGDVVVSVDGRTIRGVDDAAAIYARLLEARKFVVVVRRGADIVKFRYRFRK